MLSKALIKLVQSLDDKKARIANKSFVVEGNKNVAELLHSKIKVLTLFTTNDWLISNENLIESSIEVIVTNKDGIKKLSFLQTPQDVIALAEIPQAQVSLPEASKNFVLALDTIQDPGNLGTIIRIADWYGIKDIVCELGSCDVYAPKVIQATMGSFTRVNVTYTDLYTYIQNNQSANIYGAVLDGQNLYQTPIEKGILLIGNEGHGIKKEIASLINKPITIPRLGGAESLNAAVATAIICDAHARFMTSTI